MSHRATWMAPAMAAAALACPAMQAAATPAACTADEIIALDPGCPPSSGPCAITLSFDIGEECELDFGPRPVSIEGQLTGRARWALAAASLTLTPRGSIRALPGGCAGGECDESPEVHLEVSGDFSLERQDRYTFGRIELIPDAYGQSGLWIQAGGALRLDGAIVGDAVKAGDNGTFLELDGDSGVFQSAAGVISAKGGRAGYYGYAGYGGSLWVNAYDGPVVFDGLVDIRGEGVVSEDDSFIVFAQEHFSLGGVVRLDGLHELSGGGGLRVAAVGPITITGEVSATAGPSSLAEEYGSSAGEVLLYSEAGDVVVDGILRVDGTLYGYAGLIELCAGCEELDTPMNNDFSVRVGGRLSARQHRLHYYGPGRIILAGGEVVHTGVIDIQNEAMLSIAAPRNIHLGGEINARVSLLDRDWTSDLTGYGSQVAVESFSYDYGYAEPGAGRITVDGSFDFTTAGCDQGVCAAPFDILIRGCEVALGSDNEIEMRGPVGGSLRVEGEAVTLRGLIDVRGERQDGSISVAAPSQVGYACIDTPAPACVLEADLRPNEVRRFGSACVLCPGDCDGDGVVEESDLATIVGLINSCEGSTNACRPPWASCVNGDGDGDARISAADLQRSIECAVAVP